MDNEVEFQNSTHNDWHVFSIIGRIDVATSAAVEETGTATLTAAEKNRAGYVSNRLHFQRGLAGIVAPQQKS